MTVKVIEPSLPPPQLTSVETSFMVTAAGSEIITVEVEEHKFESSTSTVQVPAHSPVAVLVVCPLLQVSV